MSAYIVDKQHILYLVRAAMDRRIAQYGFSWCVDDATKPNGYRRGEIKAGDYERASEAGNMLWRENIASVSKRYPNESSATLPGPIDETFVIESSDIHTGFYLHGGIEPVQVIKACDCYEYQSCEHDGWKPSEARAFIDSLRRCACHALPGYDAAAWGAPETLRLKTASVR